MNTSTALGYDFRRIVTGLLAVCSLSAPFAQAQKIATGTLPKNPSISAGQAHVATTGSLTQVTQTSQKAVINWDSFNIGSNAQVNFKQPTASAVTLNRVIGTDSSVIDGLLTANGQVFLINPAGIYFGQTSRVNVGGLVASTLSMQDADFLGSQYRFSRNGSNAAVVNQGTLAAAQGGYIALMAPEVRNEGLIVAQRGAVAMVAGESVLLNIDSEQLLSLQVEPATIKTLIDSKLAIEAEGGSVILSAQALDTLTSAVINLSGHVRAQSIEVDAGKGDALLTSATLDASNTASAGIGGKVKVLGNHVGLLADTRIDASGDGGGGTVLVGGNFQGMGSEANAQATYTSNQSTIRADAITQGDGGKVIIWADNSTRALGNISARGGAEGGNGGLVETSAHQHLQVTRAPDISAPQGKAGTWLIDPNDIEIVAAAGNVNATASDPFTTSDDTAQIGVDLITAAMTGGATINITTGTGGVNSQAGNITLSAPLDFNGKGSNTLNLNAAHDIILNASIRDSIAGGDGLNLNLNAGAAGTIFLNDSTINLGLGTFHADRRLNLGVPVNLTADSDIVFNGDLYESTPGNQLTVNSTAGQVHILSTGPSTTVSRLSGLDVTAVNGVELGGITETGGTGLGIRFHSPVRLLSDAQIRTWSGALSFDNTIDSNPGSVYSLLLGSNDSINLAGNVGSAQPLAVLDILGPVHLGGDVFADIAGFLKPVILDKTVSVTNTGVSGTMSYIHFDSTVDANTPGGQGLTATGRVQFAGNVGANQALATLTTNASTSLSGNVAVSNAISFNQAVSIQNTNVVVSSLNDQAVTFGSTVDAGINNSTSNLIVNTTGATTFGANVGDTRPLTSLSTNAGGTVSLKSVRTRGTQIYADDATLSGSYTTNNSAFQVGGSSKLAGASSINTGSGNVTFSGMVNETQTLDITSAGATSFTSAAGNMAPLAGLSIQGGGSISLGSVSSTGAQTYVGATSLRGSYSTVNAGFSVTGPTVLAGPTSVSTGAGLVAFGDRVDGFAPGFPLDISTLGTLNLAGSVGSRVPLGSLVIASNQGVAFGTGISIATSGSQTYTTAQALTLPALSVGTNLNVSASTGISQSGVLAVTGTTSLSSSGGNIDLPQTGNDFAGPVSLIGTNATLADANQLQLSSVTLSGDLGASVAGILSDTRGQLVNIAGHATLTAGQIRLDNGVLPTAALDAATMTKLVDSVNSASFSKIGSLSFNTTSAPAFNVIAGQNDMRITGNNSVIGTLVLATPQRLTLDGSITASGDGIAITSGSFVNNAGASALTTPAGHWYVAASSPSNINDGAMTADFRLYANEFDAMPSGNGFIYLMNKPLPNPCDSGGCVVATPKPCIGDICNPRKNYSGAVEILRIDPRAADLPTCQSESEAIEGTCIANRKSRKFAKSTGIARKHAILIGINHYTGHGVPQLETPIGDVEAIGKLLQSRLGYQTHLLSDPTKQQLVTFLNKALDWVESNDSLIIFYAGHGFQFDEGGMGYWLPVDARSESPNNWLSNADVRSYLSMFSAKQIALISDSCFAGSLTEKLEVAEIGAADRARILSRRSVIVMTSGDQEPVTDEGLEGHSIFAWSMLKHLSELGGMTPSTSIFPKVRDDVTKAYPQTPQLGAVLQAGHEQGTDYLLEPGTQGKSGK